MEGRQPVEINGQNFGVKLIRAKLRNSYAKIDGNCIVIKIPYGMDTKTSEKTADELYKRMVKALQRAPGRFLENRLEFHDGQVTRAFGREFLINIEPKNAKNGSVKVDGSALIIKVPRNMEEHIEREMVSKLAVKGISRAILPLVNAKITALNDAYFNSKLNGTRINNSKRVWGSCSPENVITLNFKLLYSPPEIMDYVIVHELCHTKIKSHSKRFWKAVANVIPDYKEKKKWLRESSYLIKS